MFKLENYSRISTARWVLRVQMSKNVYILLIDWGFIFDVNLQKLEKLRNNSITQQYLLSEENYKNIPFTKRVKMRWRHNIIEKIMSY